MSLQYEVVVSPMERLPEAAGLQPPVGPPAAWSPLSSTLIYGATEAVVTDPPITTAQAERVADRVAATGREPTAIYVTHGHGAPRSPRPGRGAHRRSPAPRHPGPGRPGLGRTRASRRRPRRC
jgi:hypothetical protein